MYPFCFVDLYVISYYYCIKMIKQKKRVFMKTVLDNHIDLSRKCREIRNIVTNDIGNELLYLLVKFKYDEIKYVSDSFLVTLGNYELILNVDMSTNSLELIAIRNKKVSETTYLDSLIRFNAGVKNTPLHDEILCGNMTVLDGLFYGRNGKQVVKTKQESEVLDKNWGSCLLYVLKKEHNIKPLSVNNRDVDNYQKIIFKEISVVSIETDDYFLAQVIENINNNVIYSVDIKDISYKDKQELMSTFARSIEQVIQFTEHHLVSEYKTLSKFAENEYLYLYRKYDNDMLLPVDLKFSDIKLVLITKHLDFYQFEIKYSNGLFILNFVSNLIYGFDKEKSEQLLLSPDIKDIIEKINNIKQLLDDI